MLSVRLLRDNRLSVGKFWGVRVTCDFQLHRVVVLFKGHYIDKIEKSLKKKNLPKVTSEEIEDPNSPISSKEI